MSNERINYPRGSDTYRAGREEDNGREPTCYFEVVSLIYDDCGFMTHEWCPIVACDWGLNEII